MEVRKKQWASRCTWWIGYSTSHFALLLLSCLNTLVIEDDERNRRKKMVLLRHNVLPARIVRRREKLSYGENRRQRRKQKGRTKEEKKNAKQTRKKRTLAKEKFICLRLEKRKNLVVCHPYAFLFYPRAHRVIPSAEGYYVFGLLN